jgi:hypothetical protein
MKRIAIQYEVYKLTDKKYREHLQMKSFGKKDARTNKYRKVKYDQVLEWIRNNGQRTGKLENIYYCY